MLCALCVVAGVLWLRASASAPPRRPLRVEPAVENFGGKIFAETEGVTGDFRLRNTSGRPLVITAVNTSCSCVSSVAQGATKTPFTIASDASIVLTLSTTPLAIRGLEQSFTATIESSAEGKRLPNQYASIVFRVADTLKPEPPELRVYEASEDEPTKHSIVLYTFHDARAFRTPKLALVGSKNMTATIRPSEVAKDDNLKTLPRFIVDLLITPDADNESISGTVDVEIAGQKPLSIPVSCVFRRATRVNPRVLAVAGKAGSVVERDLFQEYPTDEWSKVAVAAKPRGCTVAIGQFDAYTNRIHLTIPIPRDLKSDESEIVLASSDGSNTKRVPIRYAREE